MLSAVVQQNETANHATANELTAITWNLSQFVHHRSSCLPNGSMRGPLYSRVVRYLQLQLEVTRRA